MKTLNDKSHLGVEGHVIIRDADTGEMLLDKYNAINFENFALAGFPGRRPANGRARDSESRSGSGSRSC